MKLAIMQPYFFPYIGYFQLIKAVDKLIFYDDVNYIKGGWINRNTVLMNNKKHFLTMQLDNPSSFKKINEIQVGNNALKLLKTIQQSYCKAPFFDAVFPLIENILKKSVKGKLLSEVAANSVIKISEYLQINTQFEFSSTAYADTLNIGRTNRIIEICKRNKAKYYINAIGGRELYKKEDFAGYQIDLLFIETECIEYKQFEVGFVPFLSIIDVMMFNSIPKIKNLLTNYSLI